MSKKQNNDRKSRDKKHRPKYLVWIFGVLILSILLITIIGHFWLIPAKVHRKVEKGLLKFWDGQVRPEDIEINYFGPVSIGKIFFLDRSGRQCCYAEMVKITLTNWPGLHPVVTGIEIGRLNLQILSEDKKLIIPIVHPPEQKAGSKKTVDIRNLAINALEISIADAQGKETLYSNLQFLTAKKGGFYDCLLKRINSVPSESLLAKGRIDSKTFETQISLHIKHAVPKPEMTSVFTALNIPNLSAEGNLKADLTITGSLKQPAELKPQGIISLDEWTVAMDEKIIAGNLTAKANVKDRQFDFENITANVCNGSITGSFYVESKQNQPIEFSGRLSAQNMSFVEMTSILGGPGKKATKGTVIFNYNFSGKGKDLQNLIGEGQIFLDDADISVIPIVPYIFNTVGLSQLDPLKMSDAQCSFTNAGPVVTIKTAHITNRFAAIRAEPGGTINLQTKQINIYVKAVLLKQIDAIIKRIPIVNIFDNLKDKLTRLKIQGNWSDPPSKLIKKEPIKDIKEATVGFLKDVINSGGQITQQMRKKSGNSSKPENQQNTN